MDAEVGRAWQISPISRLLVEGAFVLDGTMRFHDKPQGRSVLRDAKRGWSSRAASDDNSVKVDINPVAMVPQRHNEEKELRRMRAKFFAAIRSQLAFLAKWEQENDDPSRMHAEDSKNSHKLDPFWRHKCWWTNGRRNAAATVANGPAGATNK